MEKDKIISALRKAITQYVVEIINNKFRLKSILSDILPGVINKFERKFLLDALEIDEWQILLSTHSNGSSDHARAIGILTSLLMDNLGWTEERSNLILECYTTAMGWNDQPTSIQFTQENKEITLSYENSDDEGIINANKPKFKSEPELKQKYILEKEVQQEYILNPVVLDMSNDVVWIAPYITPEQEILSPATFVSINKSDSSFTIENIPVNLFCGLQATGENDNFILSFVDNSTGERISYDVCYNKSDNEIKYSHKVGNKIEQLSGPSDFLPENEVSIDDGILRFRHIGGFASLATLEFYNGKDFYSFIMKTIELTVAYIESKENKNYKRFIFKARDGKQFAFNMDGDSMG
jgi:hypothetical protein